MDELQIMNELNIFLNEHFDNHLVFLLHGTTHIIHVYGIETERLNRNKPKRRELARIELVRGNKGNYFLSMSHPDNLFERKNIKLTEEFLQGDE